MDENFTNIILKTIVTIINILIYIQHSFFINVQLIISIASGNGSVTDKTGLKIPSILIANPGGSR